MDKVELEFEFAINSPEAKAEAEQVKKSITGVGDTAEQQAKRVQDNVRKMVSAPVVQPKNSLFNLQTKLEEAKNASFTEKNTSKLLEYNRTIERTEQEINRLKNSGKTGFDELGNAVGKTTNVAGKAFNGLKLIANILPGLGIAGLLGFAVGPIIDYISKLDIFRNKANDAKVAQDDVAKALAGTEYAKAVTNVNELTINIDLAKQGLISKESVLKQYNGTIGKTTGEVKTLDQAEKELAENAENFIKITLLKAAAQVALENAAKKAYEAEISRRKRLEEFSSVNDNFGQGNLRGINTVTGEVDEKVRAQIAKQNAKNRADERAKEAKALQADADQQKTIAQKFFSDAAEISKKNGYKNFLGNDDKVKPKTVTANKADGSKAILTAEENLQEKLLAIKTKYQLKSLEKNEEAKKSIIAEFAGLTTQLTKQAKVYDDFVKKNGQAKADALGLKKPDASVIEPIRQAALDNLTYEQDTAKFGLKLEEDKKLYAEYESFKTTFGEAKAKERFGNELKSNKDLIEQLTAENKKLAPKGNISSLTGPEQERLTQNKKDIAELQNLEDKRYAAAYESALTTAQKIARIDEKYKAQAISIRQQAAIDGVNPDDQIAVLNEKWTTEVNGEKDVALQKTEIYKKLSEETIELTSKQVKEQIAILKKLMANGSITGDAKTELQNQLGKLEFFLKVGVNQSNLDALKNRLANLTKELNATDGAGNSIVSPKETKRILKDLADIQAKINKITNPDTGKAKSSFAQGLEDNFHYLKGSAEDVAKGVSKDLGQVSGALGDLSNAFGGLDTDAGYALGTVSELASVGSDAAGAFASFASGDIVGGVTGAIKAVTGLFSIGKRVKEMNAAARQEVADFYANAISGERVYQDLLAQRALQNVRDNKIVLKGIRDEVALRKTQLSSYAKETAEIMAKLQGQSSIASETYKHGTWLRKAKVTKTYSSLAGKSFEQLSQLLAQGKLEGDAKALVERLKEIEEKGYDAEQAMADLARETSELFTGTSADNLTNSLLDMFKSGKTGAQDLADFFKETMDDAALSIFKNKVLSDLMIKFYDEFDKAAQSDESLTDSEITNLQNLFTSLTDDAKRKFEELKKITGSDLGADPDKDSKNPNNVVTGIKGMSQQTAEVIAGQFGGQRIATLEGNEIARANGATAMDQLAQMKSTALIIIKIEDNTRRSAEAEESYLPYLKSIDNKLSNDNNKFRATGNG